MASAFGVGIDGTAVISQAEKFLSEMTQKEFSAHFNGVAKLVRASVLVVTAKPQEFAAVTAAFKRHCREHSPALPYAELPHNHFGGLTAHVCRLATNVVVVLATFSKQGPQTAGIECMHLLQLLRPQRAIMIGACCGRVVPPTRKVSTTGSVQTPMGAGDGSSSISTPSTASGSTIAIDTDAFLPPEETEHEHASTSALPTYPPDVKFATKTYNFGDDKKETGSGTTYNPITHSVGPAIQVRMALCMHACMEWWTDEHHVDRTGGNRVCRC